MATESKDLSKEKPKSCELCQSKKAIVFCRANFAFLCLTCIVELSNAKNDIASKCQLQHGWTCIDCAQDHAAVAIFDANESNDDHLITTLCVTCDENEDVHPLMRRHKRIMVKCTMPHY